jgi:hypothetical protein
VTHAIVSRSFRSALRLGDKICWTDLVDVFKQTKVSVGTHPWGPMSISGH